MATRTWLLKTDPETFSWADLLRAPRRTTGWDGVRNFQARNFLRDDMKKGDGVLVYHSGGPAPAVVGTAVVAREAYPDPTQFDPASPGYDPASSRAAPRWVAVEIAADRELARAVPLAVLRETPGLGDMALLRRGNRLSVMPVTAAEWKIIRRLGGAATGRTR